MNKSAALIAALLLCSLPALAQKRATHTPRKAAGGAIRFQGAPQYTDDELLAAAGLKQGAHLTAGEIKARARQLNDTGLFAAVKFSTGSKGLLFTLTPATELYPIHLDNLPLKPGKELEDALHARVPLYRGAVPASGSVLDAVCHAFEQMLAAQGVNATVKAEVTSGLGPKKITAANFTITAPPVRIGAIRLSGVSPAMQPKVDALVATQTGNAFDTENSAAGIEHAFEDLYQDHDYAAVQIQVAEADPPLASDQAIAVPFTVAIAEGGVYKLGSIDYPADALVPRAVVQKLVSKYQAGSGRPLELFLEATRNAYHAHGYMDCTVTARASFNQATHIVNYAVEIAPGQPYRVAGVQFDGAPDAMAAKLAHLWKLAPGQPFDDSYASTFTAQAQKKDRSLSKWLQTVVSTYDLKPDTAAQQVTVVYHFTKAAQGGH